MAKCVGTPVLIFEKNKRRSIDQPGKAWRLGTSPGEGVVGQAHGDDLTNGIGKGDLIPNNRGKRKPTDEEDQDELERGHLLARAPSHDTNNHDQEQIPEKSPQY